MHEINQREGCITLMDLPDIPDSISFARIKAFIEDELAISTADMTRDGITIGHSRVVTELYAKNADGHRYLEGNEIVTHKISIPITHEETRDAHRNQARSSAKSIRSDNPGVKDEHGDRPLPG